MRHSYTHTNTQVNDCLPVPTIFLSWSNGDDDDIDDDGIAQEKEKGTVEVEKEEGEEK